MKRLPLALLVALLLPLTPVAAIPQVARVSGIVKDEAGKPVAGATVIASNADQAPSNFSASTDDKGRFAILGLRRGTWVFTVVSPGFQPARATGEVQVNKPNAPLTVTLRPGTPAPAGPAVTTSAAELQAIIDAAETAAASGNLDGAVTGYRDLVSKVPALTSAYLRLGGLLEQKGDPAGALETYRQLAKIDPTNVRASEAIARLARNPA